MGLDIASFLFGYAIGLAAAAIAALVHISCLERARQVENAEGERKP